MKEKIEGAESTIKESFRGCRARVYKGIVCDWLPSLCQRVAVKSACSS